VVKPLRCPNCNQKNYWLAKVRNVSGVSGAQKFDGGVVIRDEELAEEQELCPTCGTPLVWNAVMKWNECPDESCQWHGKREK
jgi:hypothetical protein